jgi:disulfide bond formation protein DsbB
MIRPMSPAYSPSIQSAQHAHWAVRMLMLTGLGSLLALAVALIAQHAFGVEPCAWCVVQRIAVILVAVVSIAAVLLARVLPRAAPAVGAVLVAALSVGGCVAAWHQHTVAAKQLSCAFTWADRTLMTLQLDAIWPALFRVGSTCADAAQSTLLGLSFEVWSGVWFVLCALAAVAALHRLTLRPRRLFR